MTSQKKIYPPVSVTSFARIELKLVCGYPHARETSSMRSRSIPRGSREGIRPNFAHPLSSRRVLAPAIDRGRNFRGSHETVELEISPCAFGMALPTRRPAANNNSFPPKRALIMARTRAQPGKPAAKRSFVETTMRASIATSKRNRHDPIRRLRAAALLSDNDR